MKHIKIDRPSGHLLLNHQARKRSPPDWSAIQTDLLHEISTRVTDDVDYIRFRSVCSHWRSAAPKRPSIPWLVIEYKDDIRLNSPNSNSHVHRSPDFPLPKGTFIIGSCRGWLSLIDDLYRISIHNPITGAHVRLPVIADMPWMTDSHPFEPMTAYWLLYRVLFSSDPMDDGCVFIGLACNKQDIIYCRAKDDCWSLIPTPYGHSDFIFYRGNCYAASNYTLHICDYQSQDTQFTIIPPANPLFSDNNDHFRFSQGRNRHLRCFLVVSSGDLYLVGIRCPHLRMLCQPPYCAHCEDFNCEVFRVDLLPGDESKPNLRLFTMQDLGGRAFFLGMKSMSVSVSPGDSPWCRPNCIYLLMAVSIPDEYEEERQFYFHDGFIYNNTEEIIVIFNMEDGRVSFRPVVFNDRLDATGLHWLTPSLRY